MLTAQFSYITLFSIPWRVANAVHLLGKKRSCDEGHDFYGRTTSGIWFHTDLPHCAPPTHAVHLPSVHR